MSDRLKTFREYRERMNARILDEDATLVTKRFFNLDTRCYEDGALPAKTKEMLGLSASLVLRCDDCIAYHVIRCAEEGFRDEELQEAFSVGLVVGGELGAEPAFLHLDQIHIGVLEHFSDSTNAAGFQSDGCNDCVHGDPFWKNL